MHEVGLKRPDFAMTIHEIAAEEGISHQAVSQIIERALNKMQKAGLAIRDGVLRELRSIPCPAQSHGIMANGEAVINEETINPSEMRLRYR